MSVEDAVREKLKGVSEVNIVVVGCYGVGKSTLINSLFFETGHKYTEKAMKGHAITEAKDPYVLEINGVKYNIYDSPGLQDGIEDELDHLQWISQQHDKIHLVIYCTRMGEAVRPAEIEAMKNVTTAFTESIWNNTVIALTFANMVEAVDPDMEDDYYFEKVRKEKVENLKSIFKEFSFEEATLEKIKQNIYPVGSARKLILPGQSQDWRIDFWRGCLDACDPESKQANFQLSQTRRSISMSVAGTTSTASGAIAIAGGVGSTIAGIALTATGILAPIGIPLIVGGLFGIYCSWGSSNCWWCCWCPCK